MLSEVKHSEYVYNVGDRHISMTSSQSSQCHNPTHDKDKKRERKKQGEGDLEKKTSRYHLTFRVACFPANAVTVRHNVVGCQNCDLCAQHMSLLIKDGSHSIARCN